MEQVDRIDLKSIGVTRRGSSPLSPKSIKTFTGKVNIECRGSYKKIYDFLRTVAKTGILVLSRWESDKTIITITCDKSQYENITSVLDGLKCREFKFIIK